MRTYSVALLSYLAAVVVSGTYMFATMPPTHMRVFASQDGVALVSIIAPFLFLATLFGTGMALYRYFGDAQHYAVTSENGGKFVPVLLLYVGICMAARHGNNIRWGSGRVVDWVMVATGLALLALSVWGIYRALWVHRKSDDRFYNSR
jgi:hypothetical protein